ncbi:MAG: DUF3224 domain-containing protein [Thermoplasmata archaeon]|nr:DUF3224 domain-containing protein [Thermoplasmata archaeon]
MTTARGRFDVEMKPDGEGDLGEDSMLERLVVEKEFHGDFEGSSRGWMLTGMTAVEGSAGYVLIERLRGRLNGRAGSFLLQHSGTLDRGVPTQRIEVVPDSGADELRGLTGQMTIRIADGEHSYEFSYTLPDQP